ncbi:putative zinc dependent protease [Fictibacillus macauensis ZFHKF-1]|uniref:Putative zinc dependent protease n=2 Tax=Fictibacillus TaxID=1329200 RepID=I8UIQ7_9BACL|nr:putative zinc dependent protease [Fictibacillus macauensis ZFHKF-1]
METFISTVKGNPAVNVKETLLTSFCFKEEEFETMSFFGLFHYTKELSVLEKQVALIKALDLERLITEELKALARQYPTKRDVQFDLFLLDEQDAFVRSKLGGVSAFTDWNGIISFVVFPAENVRHTLKSVITHEYHHLWRMSAVGGAEEEETLLDRLILEGLAEHFVKNRLGEHNLGPYKEALTKSEALSLWESTFKHSLDCSGAATDPFMFGSKEKGLPFWGGYAIGFYLIERYMEKNSSLSIEELTLLPSAAFVAEDLFT